jgi:hypothetical protein
MGLPTLCLCSAAGAALSRSLACDLQITFQPYACRLLDTLRRLAVYGLMSTCFMLMLVTLSEAQDHDRLLAACMIIVALINTGVCEAGDGRGGLSQRQDKAHAVLHTW